MTHYIDRFFAAVSVLAGDGHIKQRLTRAFQDNLLDLEDDLLPIALQEPFADLKRRMHQVQPQNGEGPIRASVRKMSTAEASECARQMLTLYVDLLRLSDDTADVLPLHRSEQPMLPPFLVKSVS